MDDPAASPAGAAADPAPGARGFVAAGLEALRTRLDLATVELEIHILLLVRMLAWIIAAVACVLLALAFGVTALIMALWDTHRMLGLLGASVICIVLAAVMGYLGMRTLRRRPGVLSGSLEQLAQDERRIAGAP